jgi:hypothetical protein
MDTADDLASGTSGAVSGSHRSSQELDRGVRESSSSIAEDRSMASIRNHPKGGPWNSAIHFHRHLNWVERIAVAMNDQRWCAHFG